MQETGQETRSQADDERQASSEYSNVSLAYVTLFSFINGFQV
jgi:hypothetical protein